MHLALNNQYHLVAALEATYGAIVIAASISVARGLISLGKDRAVRRLASGVKNDVSQWLEGYGLPNSTARKFGERKMICMDGQLTFGTLGILERLTSNVIELGILCSRGQVRGREDDRDIHSAGSMHAKYRGAEPSAA